MKRKPFTNILDPELLRKIRIVAARKDQKLYEIFEEAISDYLKKGK